MTTVLFTDESRTSPVDPDGLTKGWVFKDDNCAMGIPRQQSGSVVMIRSGMIANEVTGLFRVPEELKLPADMYCSFLEELIDPKPGNLLLAQLQIIIFLRDNLHA